LRLAAIDIGSNACRLLITEVVADGKSKPRFNKLNLVRVPLRLGFDVFDTGIIPPVKVNMMLNSMHAYAYLMKTYGVSKYVAVATSAMRDARNADEIVERIYNETGIEIKVISGDFEASLIYESHIAENLDAKNNYLYIDVGGGSTELTLFMNGQLTFKQSFNIGTIRLLKGHVGEDEWTLFKETIRREVRGLKSCIAIGTGGNINKIFSLSKKKDGKPVHLDLLKEYYRELSLLSLEERMRLFSLREDRADVIVPALLIYTQVMKWGLIEEMIVPKIGIVDGLVQHLYEELSVF
jgi:exopolyphosphatase/guanosine-5'-triphosphate,3'-diphosphate pyrophosphatase